MKNLPILEAYKHCPRCGHPVQPQGSNLLKCTSCHFNFYINSAPCAGIIVVNENKEILLTKRAIEPFIGTWDVAGGFIELNETFETAAIREMAEELHIEIKINEIIGTIVEKYPFGNIEMPILAIIASAIQTGGSLKVDDDVAEAKYFKADEIESLNIAYPELKKMIINYAKTLQSSR